VTVSTEQLLRPPAGDEVPVHIVSVMRDEDCTLRLKVGWTAFQRVLSDGLFNLLPQVLPEQAMSLLQPDRDVLLALRLRPPLLPAIGDASADDVLAAIDGSGPLASLPLGETETWFATEITQEVDVPAHLEGSLDMGFATLWSPRRPGPGTHTDDDDPHITYRLPFVDRIRDLLENSEWQWELVDEAVWRLPVIDEDGSETKFTGLLAAYPDVETVVVWAVFPSQMPEHRRDEVARYLIGVNYELAVGAFEMDLSDGEVRFRVGVPIGDMSFDSDALHGLLLACFHGMAEQYLALETLLRS
jgi:hypothetical protein